MEAGEQFFLPLIMDKMKSSVMYDKRKGWVEEIYMAKKKGRKSDYDFIEVALLR